MYRQGKHAIYNKYNIAVSRVQLLCAEASMGRQQSDASQDQVHKQVSRNHV